MSSTYLSAGIFGTYGPFHCLTPSRSNTTASTHSTKSTSTSSSTTTTPTTSHTRPSSPSSIRSINTILFSRRRKSSPRRMGSTSSVLPLSVAQPNDFLRMNDGIYDGIYDDDCCRSPRSDSRRRRRAENDSSSQSEGIVGLMEPRPREVVGWGIGEVLEGGRL